MTLSNGVRTQVPALPFEYDGARPDLYRDLPKIGEHNNDVARELGYSDEDLKRLRPFAQSDARSRLTENTTTLPIFFNGVINIHKIDRCIKDA